MKRYIRPIACHVTIPGTRQALPTRGAEVEWSTYWQRALDGGEVTDEPEPAKAPAKKEPTK